MKWYFWVLLGLALVLTAIAIVAAVNSGKKKAEKTEAEVIKSSPDTLATSRSMVYQSLGRIADRAVQGEPLLRPCTCSNPGVTCADQPGQNQCYECCKGKGSTMLSWGGVAVASRVAAPCTTCG